MRTLKYGGDLQIGDFIGISYTNCIIFGWYCGDGRGTLQYYNITCPMNAMSNYESWKKDFNNGDIKPDSWRAKQYKNGFTKKDLWKDYINSIRATRIIKINRPEEILTNAEDREYYERSKEILLTLNFIKK